MPFGNRDQKPSQQELLTAMNTYYAVDIDNIPELQRVLEKHQKALLHDMAIFMIKMRISEYRQSPASNQDRIIFNEERLHLLEETRTYGITTALQRHQQQRISQITNFLLDLVDRNHEND